MGSCAYVSVCVGLGLKQYLDGAAEAIKIKSSHSGLLFKIKSVRRKRDEVSMR